MAFLKFMTVTAALVFSGGVAYGLLSLVSPKESDIIKVIV